MYAENFFKNLEIESAIHIHNTDDREKLTKLLDTLNKIGIKYTFVTEHIHRLEKNNRREKCLENIEKINQTESNPKIIFGAEGNITNINGNIDIPQDDEVKFLIASVHEKQFNPEELESIKKAEKEQQAKLLTKTIVNAINSKKIDVIGHPNRKLLDLDMEKLLNWDKIIEAAKKNNVAIEYNLRSPLNQEILNNIIKQKCLLAIGIDFHSMKSHRLSDPHDPKITDENYKAYKRIKNKTPEEKSEEEKNFLEKIENPQTTLEDYRLLFQAIKPLLKLPKETKKYILNFKTMKEIKEIQQQRINNP